MLKTNNEIMGLLKTFEIPVHSVTHTAWNSKYKNVSVYTVKSKMKKETIEVIFGKKCAVNPFGNFTEIMLKTVDTVTPY